MKRIVLLFALMSVISLLSAQTAKKDYAKELKKDVIEVIDHQYVYSSYFLLKNSKTDVSIQCKLYSTAPKSLISRDNFTIYTASLFSIIAAGSLLDDDDFLNDDIKFIELDEPIGDVDASIQILMTKNGLQTKITSGADSEMFTMTWQEIFED